MSSPNPLSSVRLATFTTLLLTCLKFHSLFYKILCCIFSCQANYFFMGTCLQIKPTSFWIWFMQPHTICVSLKLHLLLLIMLNKLGLVCIASKKKLWCILFFLLLLTNNGGKKLVHPLLLLHLGHSYTLLSVRRVYPSCGRYPDIFGGVRWFNCLFVSRTLITTIRHIRVSIRRIRKSPQD